MHQVEPHSVYQAAPRFGGLVLPPLSLSLSPLVLTHELRTTTGSPPPPPPPPSLCFPSVRPLCAFTLLRRRALSCRRRSHLQSHIDVPPGDTSTHRSPTISNGFVLIGRESGEKGARSQYQSQSQSQSGENMSATNIGHHQGLKPLQQNNSQTPGLQGGVFSNSLVPQSTNILEPLIPEK